MKNQELVKWYRVSRVKMIFRNQSRRSNAVKPTLTPTFGVFCLLFFAWIIISQKLPIGQLAVIGAITASLLRPTPFEIPRPLRWYMVYVTVGFFGLAFTDYRPVVIDQLISVLSIFLVGLATANLIRSERDRRVLAIGYLAIFALYPVRGAIFNYALGNTVQGRIAWNFFFSNPNDLAMACFLPLGLCVFVAMTEAGLLRIAAIGGLFVVFGVQLLTQSRGALIGFGAGVLYFLVSSPRRLRSLIVLAVIVSVAAALAPKAVWERMAGLTKASTGDMTQVDPEQSASSRWTIMGVGLEIAGENPLVGVGVGAYPFAHARATAGRAELSVFESGLRDAHSFYIRPAAETGFLGAFAIFMFVCSSILFCRRTRTTLPNDGSALNERLAILALEASMLAYAVGGVFCSLERSTFTIFQFVFSYALARCIADSFRNATQSEGQDTCNRARFGAQSA